MEVDMTVEIIITGIGATLLMDFWALARKRLFGVAAPVRGERVLGWTFHYLTGLLFAAAFLVLVGGDWLQRPTPGPALLFGALTVAAPLLLMQPGFGMGLAAARTPRPWQVRSRALATHLVFGLGLYLAGLLLALR